MTTSEWKPPGPGALDDRVWPDKLVARAVQCDETDERLHGYSVIGDLARYYSFSDTLYVAICGELPDARASVVFELALAAAAAGSVREPPAHIAVLSRICGAHIGSAFAAGTVALAEQARALVDEQAELVAWCANPIGAVPASACSETPDPWIANLRATASARQVTLTLLRDEMSRPAARLVLLIEAGLQRAEQLQAAIVLARSVGVVAEALQTGARDLAQYPAKLPPFHYVEEVLP